MWLNRESMIEFQCAIFKTTIYVFRMNDDKLLHVLLNLLICDQLRLIGRFCQQKTVVDLLLDN